MSVGTEYLGLEARPVNAVMPALPQDIVTGVTASLVALLFAYALWQAFSAKRNDRWLIMLVAAPFAAIAVYAPVSLPAATALYREGAGYDQTVLAAGLSILVGLGMIFAARHLLLLSAGRLQSGAAR